MVDGQTYSEMKSIKHGRAYIYEREFELVCSQVRVYQPTANSIRSWVIWLVVQSSFVRWHWQVQTKTTKYMRSHTHSQKPLTKQPHPNAWQAINFHLNVIRFMTDMKYTLYIQRKTVQTVPISNNMLLKAICSYFGLEIDLLQCFIVY